MVRYGLYRSSDGSEDIKTLLAVPIIYEVHRLRDGKSFATRRVDAIQKGTVIFTLLVSFQVIYVSYC